MLQEGAIGGSMSCYPARPSSIAAGVLALVIGTASFSSHAMLTSLIPGMGNKKCPSAAGTLRIVEPDDGLGAWASYGLPAPTRMLRVMVNDSKCFTVLDRGVGFAAAQAERELARAGHLQGDQNIGAGQMRGADFVLIPDIISQNPNAGGSHVGGSASSGQKRGLLGGMLNVATLGIAGKMSSNKQTAQVVLTLVDVRTSEQVVSVTGDAKITDRAWSAMVEASNVQGGAGVRVGTWENTEIGKVIMEAYDEAFEEMVGEIQKRGSVMFARRAPQAVMPTQVAVAPASQEQVNNTMLASLPAPAMPPSALETLPPAYPTDEQVGVSAEESEAGPGSTESLVSRLAKGGTLALRRTARLLAGASSQAEMVAELAMGMLVFPTGNTQGSMLEVEDEMGNKGWVPSVAVSATE
ncbi:CsgG/HfaB family protein [Stenotrophomonas sp. SY1]|uniref:CsgG/HfaB family protein n=1 Tax=Stenotrophomonas sp. SY1 TaxID=477235 RepID=UPI001E2A64B1|nr:CsgG/HfaB family protein [Stenotrophomonas sp. SY1]MCD9086930.1 CsgG/HfaB family protein [Stenotrophomonas sp. SY1]